jgi:hypothetical protein
VAQRPWGRAAETPRSTPLRLLLCLFVLSRGRHRELDRRGDRLPERFGVTRRRAGEQVAVERAVVSHGSIDEMHGPKAALGRVEDLDAERRSGRQLGLDDDHGRIGPVDLPQVARIGIRVLIERRRHVQVDVDITPGPATIGQHGCGGVDGTALSRGDGRFTNALWLTDTPPSREGHGQSGFGGL